jgi:predicted GH43/DUF377 family glycosyl hydrolase
MIKLVFSSVLVFLFFSSCTQDSITTPPIDSVKYGSVLFKIDKENAPSNVTIVTAKLSRSGYTTISSSLNILTDTSASLQLTNIAVGTWNLIVEAFNNQNTVVYRGETQVSVLENLVSQVSLILNPVSSGVGSISIFVTWGSNVNPTSNWIDYLSNPILQTIFNNSSNSGVYQPFVLFDGAIYHMWFEDVFANGATEIYYASSVNGLQWTRNNASPVFTRGALGSWDSHSVQPGAVIKDGNYFKMYYFGNSSESLAYKIGFATSIDGITWEKYPNPILGAISNENNVASSSVVKIDSNYYMYYSKFSPYRIFLAISNDGVNWTPYGNAPVLSANQSWEGAGIYEASVIYEMNLFKMVYMNSTGKAFGYATSTDGKNWQKSSTNPIFKTNNTANGWANYQIAYPCLVRSSEELRIYYSGGTSSVYKVGVIKNIP